MKEEEKKVKKIIIIENCLECPKWMKCSPSKKLTAKQKFTLKCGVGVGDFILKGCPLSDLQQSIQNL